jgi:hypothetical protein
VLLGGCRRCRVVVVVVAASLLLMLLGWVVVNVVFGLSCFVDVVVDDGYHRWCVNWRKEVF